MAAASNPPLDQFLQQLHSLHLSEPTYNAVARALRRQPERFLDEQGRPLPFETWVAAVVAGHHRPLSLTIGNISRKTKLPMRLLTWNCAMSFRRKTSHLAALAPDIAAIQECERPEKWPDTDATSVVWHGDNPHKGLAVMAFGPWRVEPAPVLDPTIEYVLPVEVSGPQPFRLLGVWTKPHRSRERSYVGQLHAALDAYTPWLQAGPSVLAGDLNSNAIWDTPRRPAHARLVARLADCGLASAYHAYTGEAHGAETQPTLYLLKQARRPYHLDYLFLPQDWLPHLKTVQVGAADAWLAYSDHVPVVADVQL